MQHHQAGRLQEAESIYKKILGENPDHPDALHLLGLLAHQVGKNDLAEELIKTAILKNPKNRIYYNHLGNALNDMGRSEEAVSCFQKALELNPDYADAYNNMGNALQDLGRLSEALFCYQKALALQPDLPEAHNNMGNAFRALGRLAEAVSCFRKAVALQPRYAEAYNNMGYAFENLDRLNEALSCYQQALRLKPGLAGVYNNTGNVLKNLGRLDEAIQFYRKAIQLEPENAEAYGSLVQQLRRTCAWQDLESLSAKLDTLTQKALHQGTQPAEGPFINITRHPDPAYNLAVARAWSSDITQSMSSLKHDFSFDERIRQKGKIIVGYLSNNFQDHPMAHVMLGLFGLHDRKAFKIFCYSYGRDDGSTYRARISRDCDRFVDVRDLSHVEAAQAIHQDGVDILVDLNGLTQGSRLAICALRPAPVQVRYLGMAGTTGADFFDYIVTDRVVTPEDQAHFFSEHFVYLPHSYQVNDSHQAISDRVFRRVDVGLPEGRFGFCSFNSSYKLDPDMFALWMAILQQTPESVLWLQKVNETVETNLRREAASRGVDPERLVFGEKLPKHEHLARLRLADLALDTRIVNGAATTSDALWVGIPVLTLQGNHFASRMSSSILTAIGLSDLIAHCPEDYRTMAVRLAQNPHELQALKQRLRENRLTRSLFDTKRFATNLEKAYTQMWNIFLAGEKPRQIEVTER